MKKIISLVLCFLMLFSVLTGCNSDGGTDTRKKVTVLAIENTPGIGVAHMIKSSIDKNTDYNYQLSTVNLANRVNSIMAEGDCDLAIVPSDTAAKLYKKTKGIIRVLAGISCGGYEIVGKKSELINISSLKGKEVFFIERDGVAEHLFRKVLTDNGLDPEKDITISYYTYDAVNMAKEMNEGTVSCAVLSSLEAATVRLSAENTSSISIADEWNKLHPEDPLTTYSVIAYQSYVEENKKVVKEFLDELETSIEKSAEGSDETLKLCTEYGLVNSDDYARMVISSSALRFTKGEEMKTALAYYYNTLYSLKPGLIGKKFPESDFYYIP